MTVGMASAVRNAMLNTITTQAGGSAVITIYNGTRPATGGTATTALCTLTCNATFANSASGGVLTLNTIANGTASASGAATWARLTTSGGTFLMDMDVGTSGTDINLNTTTIVSGATVSISAAQITAGNP